MESASPEEMERLMEEVGEIQERLEAADYYNLDAKIEEVAGGLGLRDIGLEHKVDELSGGQRTKVLLTVFFPVPVWLVLAGIFYSVPYGVYNFRELRRCPR